MSISRRWFIAGGLAMLALPIGDASARVQFIDAGVIGEDAELTYVGGMLCLTPFYNEGLRHLLVEHRTERGSTYDVFPYREGNEVLITSSGDNTGLSLSVGTA